MTWFWTKLNPVHQPPGRNMPSMVKDLARNNVMIFGGNPAAGSSTTLYLQDTWVFDGTDWTQKFPAHSPPKRTNHSFVYDRTHNYTVLFGGRSTSGSVLNDTWTWDGTDWTQQFPTHVPPARQSTFMAWDQLNSYVMIYGGTNDPITLVALANDMYHWSGTDWIQHAPSGFPTARDGPCQSMIFDPVLGNVILYGGRGSTTITYSDTWKWNGTTWTSVGPAHNIGTAQPSLTYAASLGTIMGTGGGLTSTVYQWSGTDWSNLPSKGPIDADTAAVCESLNPGKVYCFMGQSSSSTWEHDLFEGEWIPPYPNMDNEVSLAAPGTSGSYTAGVIENFIKSNK
jgi:hypothetical protein